MNVYGVRDRMLNCFSNYFIAPGDNEALGAIAQAINSPENNNAIAQAPHHFEIWRCTKLNEFGQAHGDTEFLADASALVRAGRQPTGHGLRNPQGTTPERTGAPTSAPEHTGANPELLQGQAHLQNVAASPQPG